MGKLVKIEKKYIKTEGTGEQQEIIGIETTEKQDER